MDVNITSRHCDLADSVREKAAARLRRLERYGAKLTSADVVFETDHGVKRVETRLVLAGGPTVIANGSGTTFNTALDQAVDRLGRQVKRERELRRRHQTAKLSELAVRVPGNV